MEKSEKVCTKCKIKKPISEFYNLKTRMGTPTHSSNCKECLKLKQRIYSKNISDELRERKNANSRVRRKRNKSNPNEWFSKMYMAMRTRNRNKFNLELPFTKEQFIYWIHENYGNNFYTIFNDYVESGFDKYMCPSIDRIDDYKSYTFDNMQLMTWKENDIKGSNSTKNKVSCAIVAKTYCRKPVYQFDMLGRFIRQYNSTHDIERELGFDSSLIAKCCRKNSGKMKYTAKGYMWTYERQVV